MHGLGCMLIKFKLIGKLKISGVKSKIQVKTGQGL